MKGCKPALKLVSSNSLGAVATVPKPPAWLSADARNEWRRVVPILVSRKILTRADLAGLEHYCVAVGHVRAAEAHIREHGLLVEAVKEMPGGRVISLGMRRNPSVGIVAEATNRARLLAAELGLTPVSRSRPSIRDEGDDDDLLDCN